jgi:hypothetical protein
MHLGGVLGNKSSTCVLLVSFGFRKVYVNASHLKINISNFYSSRRSTRNRAIYGFRRWKIHERCWDGKLRNNHSSGELSFSFICSNYSLTVQRKKLVLLIVSLQPSLVFASPSLLSPLLLSPAIILHLITACFAFRFLQDTPAADACIIHPSCCWSRETVRSG